MQWGGLWTTSLKGPNVFISMGCLQVGSVLGPLLFSIYINSLGENVDGATLHFYAEDTVMYCAGPSIKEAVFNIIQTQLS